MNPARVLSKILASLHDDQGRITVPNFYDGVHELPDAVADQWCDLNFDHAAFLGDVGLADPAGEVGRSALEMIWSRPTCEINGMTSGYTAKGLKPCCPVMLRPRCPSGWWENKTFKIREDFRAMVRAMVPADCQVEFLNTERTCVAYVNRCPRIRSGASGINRRMGYTRGLYRVWWVRSQSRDISKRSRDVTRC